MRILRRPSARKTAKARTHDQPRPLLEHLEELRQRLLRSLIALGIGTGIGLLIADRIIDILAAPVGGRAGLVSIDVTESIAAYMRVALLAGFALSFPYITYQILAFIYVGLLPHERRLTLLLVPLATMLFLGGAAFTYFVMMPVAIPFLTTFAGIRTEPRPSSYLSFVVSLMFWLGLSFEMPLVFFALAKARLINARQLLRAWRFAVLIIAIIAAAITPTVDPVNMSIVMVPLIALYLLSVLLAALA
ncbi:twin-arginine translocase subunit TatC [Thermoflexus sp.]|uniref:twin-arginine translocase subunit TatC n=1 Tax=Thermoflexus sp. TaxID=1969742 RepID=UPI0035E42D68